MLTSNTPIYLSKTDYARIEQLYGSALCRTARLVNSVSTLITALNEAEAILSKAGMEQGVMSTPITDRFTIDRRWFNHDDSEPEMIVSIWDDVKCTTFSKQYKLVELSLPQS